jgi:hypothetical protein
MPTATLTTCTLEVIARPKPSRYEGKPDYRPCLFKLADSSQKWKSYNEGSAELTWLKQGQTYQAAIAADGEMTLIQPTGQDTTPQTQPGAKVAGAGPDTPGTTKGAYLEALTRLGNRYGACLQESQAVLGRELGLTPDQLRERPEMVKDIATTFFIQLQRELS